MWQQPCALCGHWPVGSGGYRPGTIYTKEQFIEFLNQTWHRNQDAPPEIRPEQRYQYPVTNRPKVPYPLDGNIVKLWLYDRFFTDQLVDIWRHRAHIIGLRALDLVNSLDWPSAEEVWETYSGQPCGDPECLNNRKTDVYVSRQDSGAPFITQVPHRLLYCYDGSNFLGSHRYQSYR